MISSCVVLCERSRHERENWWFWTRCCVFLQLQP
jgi:hypothetical protein